MVPLLRRQHGVFSTTQLAELGLSRAFLSRHPDLFRQVLPRTYSVIPPPLTPMGMCWAAALWASPALVSHLSALWLHELGRAPLRQHVLVRHRRRLAVPPAVVLHRSSVIVASDAAVIDGLPVTTPVRTLVDCAALLPPRELLATTATAVQRRLCTAAELQHLATRHPALPGAARMMRALAQLEGGVESVREWDLQAALAKAGLPEPIPQFVVRDRGGRVLSVPDFAYPQWKIAIFYDGRAAHLGADAFDGDALKTAALTAAGWRVLRVTNALLKRPDLLAAAVWQLVGTAA